MKILQISAVTVAAFGLALAPAHADQTGKGSPTTHGASAHAQSAHTPTTHGNPHTTAGTSTPKAHGNPHTASPKIAPTTTALNPIAQKLQGKPLGSRIEKMLPAGMTLNTASAGFRNQGQFIAAVHVSQNLGIPFAELKAAMLGTPTTSRMSLGQAIEKLKPSANAKTEESRAKKEAEHDLETVDETPTTSSRSIAPAKPQKRDK